MLLINGFRLLTLIFDQFIYVKSMLKQELIQKYKKNNDLIEEIFR